MHRTRRWAAGAIPLAVLGTLLSCHDLPTNPATPQGKTVRSLVGCRVEVATGKTDCERLTPQGKPMGRVSGNLIPDAEWMLETQPGAYTPADSTYRLSVRITNDTEAMLGTPDGVQATGLKLFLPVHPMGYTGRQAGDTSDPYGMLIPPVQNTNNTVRARNPDGVGSFSGPDQPFWNYPEMLAPWETSGWKEWKFTVDPSVSYFYFAVSVLSYVPGERQVPSAAPDSWLIPQDSVNQLFSFQNLIIENPRESGPYPRNVVMVGFTRTATDEQKQAAIDLVGGTLIGGNGAHYYIEVAEGTEPVWTAVDALRALSQVEQALPFATGIDVQYRRPNNGAGWARADWEVHPDSARGVNWSMESISAPSAWGCETGSSGVAVAVVDGAPDHAAAVGGVVGNPGDTGNGTAGVMWNSGLVVTDASRGNTAGGMLAANLYGDLKAAVMVQHARVINLSIGRNYVDATGKPRLPVVGAANDIAAAKSMADRFSFMIRAYEDTAKASHPPLYVIAAGNFQVDASYSGIPQLANDPILGPRVIVVAGYDSMRVGSTRALWANSPEPVEPGSNTGSLPAIAAPANNVNVSAGVGSGTWLGTSFAAPHITGIAGLLFSQDTSRSAEEVRALLVAGAARGGRTAGGYPIANAYESLRKGAEKTGEPLCGNRVWAEGAQIYASRGSGREAIGPADPALVGDVLTQHGGRVILYNSTAGGGTGKALIRQPDGTWQIGAIPGDYNQQIGGATWSVRQYAHFPSDSIVQLIPNTVDPNDNTWWRTGSQVQVPIVQRYLQANGTEGRKQLGLLTIPNLPQPEASFCVEKTTGGFCTFRQISGRYWLYRIAYPQSYQPVLISVTPLRLESVDSTAWVTCTRDPSLLCRLARTDYLWGSTKVYRIPLKGGTPQLVDSLKSTVFWMGESEAPGSDSLTMAKGDWTIQYWYDPNTRSYTSANSKSEVAGCAMQYRSLGTFGTVATEIANSTQCGWASLVQADNHGGGTWSPNRAPAPPGRVGASAPGEYRIRIEDVMPRGFTLQR